jgi:hypothetical protein
MAYTFKLDKISPDGAGHVAYVKLLDSETEIASFCIPYSDDDEIFQAALTIKSRPIIEKKEAQKSLEVKIATLLSGLNPSA